MGAGFLGVGEAVVGMIRIFWYLAISIGMSGRVLGYLVVTLKHPLVTGPIERGVPGACRRGGWAKPVEVTGDMVSATKRSSGTSVSIGNRWNS